jgi:SAM-dependent methyltransferase
MTPIGDRYKDGGIATHVDRWLRLDYGQLDHLADQFPTQGRIVDLGSGASLLAHVLVDRAPEREVLCIDREARQIESLEASAVGLPIEGVVADITHCQLPPCAGIALIDVLHLLPADAQEALLDRCGAALAPGGVLVLCDPDPDGRLRFDLSRGQRRLRAGLARGSKPQGHYRRGQAWSFQLRQRGLRTVVHPMRKLAPHALRTVVATKPAL